MGSLSTSGPKRPGDALPSPQDDKRPKPSLGQEKGPKLATTFGVELEFVFAFHEKELLSILAEKDIQAQIVKVFDGDEEGFETVFARARRGHSWRNRTRYPSWVLRVPSEDPTLTAGVAPSQIGNLRTYFVEPLLIANRVLTAEGLPAEVVCEPDDLVSSRMRHYLNHHPDAQPLCALDVDYTKWTLTNDLSVRGATKRALVQTLPDRITLENSDDWDSYGIELISPILQYAEKETAFQTVGKYLSALKSGSRQPSAAEGASELTWGALASVWAGTHVHVGFNVKKSDEIPMKLLQHIAYILVSHEDLMRQLHPLNRSGIWTPSVSPRLDPQEEIIPMSLAEEENVVEANENGYTGHHNVDPSAPMLEEYVADKKILKWSQIRDAIFQERINLEDFVQMMHGNVRGGPNGEEIFRGFVVNWANLVKFSKDPSNSKPTIEFRQHACTLDEAELQHWVKLLFAIVRTAEEKLAQGQTFSGKSFPPNATYAQIEGSKYFKNEEWMITSVDDLMGPALLDLEDIEIAYWKGRYNRFVAPTYLSRVPKPGAKPQSWVAAAITEDGERFQTHPDYASIHEPGKPPFETMATEREKRLARRRAKKQRDDMEEFRRRQLAASMWATKPEEKPSEPEEKASEPCTK